MHVPEHVVFCEIMKSVLRILQLSYDQLQGNSGYLYRLFSLTNNPHLQAIISLRLVAERHALGQCAFLATITGMYMTC